MKASTRRFACVLGCAALLACSESVDTRSDGLAVYQSGAPVAPWALADEGTAGDPPTAPGMNGTAGITNPGAGGMNGVLPGMTTGTGGGSAMTGSGGIGSGSGGMTAGGTGGKGGGTGGMGSGSGGMTAGGTGGSMETGGATPTSVSFDVTTASQGGRYQPKNIGAIWVEDSSGNYVKTLEVWASIRAIYLSRWLSVNAWGDQTDAVSGATLRMHMPHHATWDLTDSKGAKVPDGDYSILVESTDADRAGKNTSIKFTKGSKPQTVMPSDDAAFTGLKLVYQ
jgi:hypothetical protein